MIDLDEARVARREEAKIKPTITFGGRVYELPAELPIVATENLKKLAAATKAKDGDAITAALLGAIEALLGDEYADFLKNSPSINDLAAVVEGIPAEYGLTLGESPASEKPSKSTTARPKPRSAKPTA